MTPKRPIHPSDLLLEPAGLKRVLNDLVALRGDLLQFERDREDLTQEVNPVFALSARNLLHYVALRQRDIRDLQENLTILGLSTLGRSESHVLAALDAIITLLSKALREPPPLTSTFLSYHEGRHLLSTHTESLFGMPRPNRPVRIMVTLPSEAADDPDLLRGLVRQGMDIARINCAHDDATAWKKMVDHVHAASREAGRPCRILMDLAGPKLRTGEIEPQEGVVRLKVPKDPYGRPAEPGRVWLSCPDNSLPLPSSHPVVNVERKWLNRLSVGEKLNLIDARDRLRTLTVSEIGTDRALVCSNQNVYFVKGLEISREEGYQPRTTKVAPFPPRQAPLPLKTGDLLLLTAAPDPGRPAERNDAGEVVTCARISCTLPEIFQDLTPGQRIFLDDGKIGGIIESADREKVLLRITRAKPGGSRLGPEKGINLPDSNLRIHGLTPEDIGNLEFVARHADMLALSFVQGPEDIALLNRRLKHLRAETIGIVLKIETRKALEHLPGVLLEAMRSHTVGVMIARGDLAVECGYEMLAEAQEEILLLCEAGHIPVIWATQVLEGLAKEGMPSRAEITDAAMAVRAECVMLNKGPYMLQTMIMLDEILSRMQLHQNKRQVMLPRLKLEGIEKDFAHRTPPSDPMKSSKKRCLKKKQKVNRHDDDDRS